MPDITSQLTVSSWSGHSFWNIWWLYTCVKVLTSIAVFFVCLIRFVFGVNTPQAKGSKQLTIYIIGIIAFWTWNPSKQGVDVILYSKMEEINYWRTINYLAVKPLCILLFSCSREQKTQPFHIRRGPLGGFRLFVLRSSELREKEVLFTDL